jgi:pimeloyl-ACP methyl ester carboxylesterase
MQNASQRMWPAVERGEGRPVVFLHGYPLNSEMWKPQLEALSNDHHVVALDLPGYGLAEEWPVPDTLAGFAEKVHLTLAARFPGPVVVVGHSFGGYLALQMYHDFPEQFSGLVLTNTRSGADTPEAREKRLATAKMLEDPAKGLDQEAVARSLVSPATWSGAGPVVTSVRSMVRAARSPTLIATLNAIAGRPDSTPVLATVNVPTAVVWGADDQLIPPAQSQAMVPLIPGGAGVEIAGAGHLPSLEAPETFNRAIRDLLARVETA